MTSPTGPSSPSSPSSPLDSWVADLAAALGVDGRAVDRDLLLDVARDAAHGVARPAAPLTTFLIGLAAGARGGSAADVRAAAEITEIALRELADRSDG